MISSAKCAPSTVSNCVLGRIRQRDVKLFLRTIVFALTLTTALALFDDDDTYDYSDSAQSPPDDYCLDEATNSWVHVNDCPGDMEDKCCIDNICEGEDEAGKQKCDDAKDTLRTIYIVVGVVVSVVLLVSICLCYCYCCQRGQMCDRFWTKHPLFGEHPDQPYPTQPQPYPTQPPPYPMQPQPYPMQPQPYTMQPQVNQMQPPACPVQGQGYAPQAYPVAQQAPVAVAVSSMPNPYAIHH
ncbi:hypothetical protein CYMTET_50825 [Cymbomonas tetramitiformis]|uniref:Uncharacterized protein n=1 Tax=Cymbomonas tetramitiformis TaxID=36881 RepID=A0AAE0BNY2_9CHLO|nr:hypothetical protein CYMTET_50825 [Cymbomonas tetramitiformis]